VEYAYVQPPAEMPRKSHHNCAGDPIANRLVLPNLTGGRNVVIGGIVSSTALTLHVLPSLYRIVAGSRGG
jgi:hypothetical protein